jgi:signal transduction histidine kinase
VGKSPPVSAGAFARAPWARRGRWSGRAQLVLLLFGFLLAVASFVGASLYADSRLAAVAERSHEVSENAMPSIRELGQMRRELAYVELALGGAAEGDARQLVVLSDHMRAYEEARSRYLALPQFDGERALWQRAAAQLVEVQSAAEKASAMIASGAYGEAGIAVDAVLSPSVLAADATLAELIRFNHDEGRRVAVEADAAWSRVRRFSLVADVVCAATTGLLAWLGLRGTRRFMAMQELRAEELEAFASRVAHDIRGPLTPALVSLKMLERELDDDPRRRGMVERGLRSLKRVEQLVEDLLNFARAAAPPEGGSHAPLEAVVAGVVQDVEAQAEAASVRVEVDPLPPCEVACPPGVLASIVMNLTTNAIKHMPAEAGTRTVTLGARLEREYVHVEVADTGAGLPETVRDRIFEPYVRLDRRGPGLGLGLATVRRLVEAYGGQVGIRPREGAGSVFWFELPTF